MRRVAMLVLVFALVAAADASAQRRQVSLEANPIHGTLGYGWHRGPDHVVGVEIGFGFPQLDRTLEPDDEALLDFMHVGVFTRVQPMRSITLDGRAKVGLAELHGCSGCMPGVLTGVSGAVFWGGRNVKIGPRLSAGVINEYREPAAFVVNLTPVALLFTHSW